MAHVVWFSMCTTGLCTLFNSFFFGFCSMAVHTFLYSTLCCTSFSLWHGIGWPVVVAGVSLCINCCLLILPLLPTFVVVVFLFSSARLNDTLFQSLALSACILCNVYCYYYLHLHFFPSRHTYHCLYAIKRRLHGLIVEAAFFTPSVPLLWFFFSLGT